jgi:hypothetical protein
MAWNGASKRGRERRINQTRQESAKHHHYTHWEHHEAQKSHSSCGASPPSRQRAVNLCLTVFISNKFVNHFFAPFIRRTPEHRFFLSSSLARRRASAFLLESEENFFLLLAVPGRGQEQRLLMCFRDSFDGRVPSSCLCSASEILSSLFHGAKEPQKRGKRNRKRG